MEPEAARREASPRRARARATAFLAWIAGPADARFATAALVALSLAALASHRLWGPPPELFPTADYAEIELYTRLAAEGSQRLGPEARFHFHHPGPAFFYAAAPVYQLLGADSAAMGWAALAWNLVALAALLRGASRIVPGTGPMLAALLCCLLLQAQGLGWLFSSWNPNVGLLPFGVALLAAARLATGEGRALAIVVLAGSLAIQSHMVFALPVALVSAAGLALATFPRLRRGLGVPTVVPGLGARSLLAALAVLLLLWALPLLDELVGDYGNIGRILAAAGRSRPPSPWPEAVVAAASAFSGFATGLLGPASASRSLVAAALLAVALVWAGWHAARRQAPARALALVTAAGMLAALAVARTAPGALQFGYVLHWVALVGVAAALVACAEAVAPWPRLAALLRGGPGQALLLLASALLLAGNVREWREGAAQPRHPDSVRAEALAQAVRTQLAAESRWPFLLRVGPGADPGVALGLILALDKARLRFTVEPFGPYRLVGRFTPRGDEVGQLLLGDIPPTGRAKPVAVPESFPVVWQAVAPPAR
jgi:hypothetical protein